MYLLGGEQGETLLEVMSELVTKHTNSTCACAVFLTMPIGKYMIEKIFVCLHFLLFSGAKVRKIMINI